MEYNDIKEVLFEPIQKIFSKQSPQLNEKQLEPFIRDVITFVQRELPNVELRNQTKLCNSCGRERKDVEYRILIDEKGNETETRWCSSCFFKVMPEHIPVDKSYKYFGFKSTTLLSDNTELNDCPICKASGSTTPVVTAIIEEKIYHPWAEQGTAKLRLVLHHGNHTAEWTESRCIPGQG